jgi:hypothetical protein
MAFRLTDPNISHKCSVLPGIREWLEFVVVDDPGPFCVILKVKLMLEVGV